MLGKPDYGAGTVGMSEMGRQQPPGGGGDLQLHGADAVANVDLAALETGADRVTIASEVDQAGVANLALDLDRDRVGNGGDRQQVLLDGELGDRALTARPEVAGVQAEVVVGELRLLLAADQGGPEPTLGAEVVVLLHRTLPLGAVGGTGRHLGTVVAGRRREGGAYPSTLVVEGGRHPVDAPLAGGPTESTQHPIDGLEQVGFILRLGEHPSRLTREGQPPLEQMQGVTPGRRQLHPVPLDLLARLVLDLDRGPVLAAGAGHAGRTQAADPDLPGEGDVAQLEAELGDLVVQRRTPDMRVVAEADANVVDERREEVGCGRLTRAGGPAIAKVGLNRVPAEADMTGDGRVGPAPLLKCRYLHVLLLRQHVLGLLV